MSKVLFIAVATLLGAVSADVAHLGSGYLPPTPGAPDTVHHFSTTSIERQELRELPTQTVYVPNAHGMANVMAMAMPMNIARDAMRPELQPQQPPRVPGAHNLATSLQQQPQQIYMMPRASVMPTRAYLSSMARRPEAHVAPAMAAPQYASMVPSHNYLAPGMEANSPQLNYRPPQQQQHARAQQLPAPQELGRQHQRQMMQCMRSVAEISSREQEMEPTAMQTVGRWRLPLAGYHSNSASAAEVTSS